MLIYYPNDEENVMKNLKINSNVEQIHFISANSSTIIFCSLDLHNSLCFPLISFPWSLRLIC